MNGSVTAIWIIVAVAVAGLAAWLGSVALAARKPHQEHAHGERLRGPVQGGMHVGAGRSVAPRRDEPIAPGEAPAGDMPESDITRVKNHLAKYYEKMGETAPWERD